MIRVRTFSQPCSAIKHSVTLNHTRSQAQRPQGGYLTTSALEKKKKKKGKLRGCTVHLKRCNHDVSCHNNSVILTCNLMFSLARGLIEKRVVGVDAFFFCACFFYLFIFFGVLGLKCTRHGTAGFGAGKRGITQRLHLATLWRLRYTVSEKAKWLMFP